MTQPQPQPQTHPQAQDAEDPLIHVNQQISSVEEEIQQIKTNIVAASSNELKYITEGNQKLEEYWKSEKMILADQRKNLYERLKQLTDRQQRLGT